MHTREDLEQCAQKLKALTDKHRLMMLHELFRGEQTVGALAAVAGLQLTMASHHLSVLHRAGIVTSNRKGRFVFYALHPDVVHDQDGHPCEAIRLGPCIVNFTESMSCAAADVRPD